MNAVHETIKPGSGLSIELREALLCVMKPIVPEMFRAQQPWALMGSAASVLQGLDGYSPPDIDILSTAEGARIMGRSIAAHGETVRDVSFSIAGPYSSYFGVYRCRGIKVEVMGDLVITMPDGTVAATDHFDHWSEKVRVLHFEDMHIPVVPLEWQLIANVLLARPERSRGIAEHLLRCGYDRAYIEAMLEDRRYGERTIRAVADALSLDG